jgi:hypothetical protein
MAGKLSTSFGDGRYRRFRQGICVTANNMHWLRPDCRKTVDRYRDASWLVLLYACGKAKDLDAAFRVAGQWALQRVASGIGCPPTEAMGYEPPGRKAGVAIDRLQPQT